MATKKGQFAQRLINPANPCYTHQCRIYFCWGREAILYHRRLCTRGGKKAADDEADKGRAMIQGNSPNPKLCTTWPEGPRSDEKARRVGSGPCNSDKRSDACSHVPFNNVVQKVSKIFADMPHRSQHPYICRRKRQHHKKHSSKRQDRLQPKHT